MGGGKEGREEGYMCMYRESLVRREVK